MSTDPRTTRIVFFGAPDFSVPALRKLVGDNWQLVGIVTTPDKPVGRHKIITPSPVKTAAQELGLAVLSPTTLKDDDFFGQFSELNPDLCVVVAYNKLIPERYLQVPRLGFLNIHPSLLPAYRGPSPVKSAILDGCTSTGVSIMLIDRDMDHGPVLVQKIWDIPLDADADFCEKELFELGANMLVDVLPDYIEGTVSPIPQNHDQATFTRKFERADGCLDWSQPAGRVHDRIRALATNPGTWTTWNGKTLNIFRAEPVALSSEKTPGTVFLDNRRLIVACGTDALVITELQLEGSKRQNSTDFLNGHPNIVSAVLG